MVNKHTIKSGDVVLINMGMWTNCLMQVDEVRVWGVTGSVVGPIQDRQGNKINATMPLRVGWDDIALVYSLVGTTDKIVKGDNDA